jgi:orotate phosphoribosyltransferase
VITAQDLEQLLQQTGALLRGHFELSSGLHSDRFIQKFRIFENPQIAESVCCALASPLQTAQAKVVVSGAVGGIIPGYIVARTLGVRNIFVERENGRPALRRGFTLQRGERALIVEDVMTTGASTAEIIEVIEAHGARVAAIGAIVKRSTVKLPYPVTALLDMPLRDYLPQECPLCAAGVPTTDPGSRRLNP